MIVVKQSMPVILSGLIGIVALIIPIFLYLVLKLMITHALQTVSVVLTIVTIVVYRKVSNSNLQSIFFLYSEGENPFTL